MTKGRCPRTPLEEAVDELNDDMAPYKFAAKKNERGWIFLNRVDTVRDIPFVNLGKEEHTAAAYVEIIVEWQREAGGLR